MDHGEALVVWRRRRRAGSQAWAVRIWDSEELWGESLENLLCWCCVSYC